MKSNTAYSVDRKYRGTARSGKRVELNYIYFNARGLASLLTQDVDGYVHLGHYSDYGNQGKGEKGLAA